MDDIWIWLGIGGFILGIINLFYLWYQDKQNQKLILNIPTKKRSFQKAYDFAYELVCRMEFTDVKENNGVTFYDYKILNSNGDGYAGDNELKWIFLRYARAKRDLHTLIGLRPRRHSSKTYIIEETIRLDDERRRMHISGKFESREYVSYPNFDLPSNTEQIKEKILCNIADLAKEFGIKIKTKNLLSAKY